MKIEYLPVRSDVLLHFILNNVFMFMATIIVVLRLVARKLKQNSFGWDDYFIIMAVPLATAELTIQGLYARLGAGYQLIEVPPYNFKIMLKLLIAYQIIFAMTLLAVKLSIMFFYLRVFVNKGLRLGVKIAMAVTLLWSAGNIMQVFLICRPLRSSWDITVPGVCGNRQGSFIAIGVFNVVTDFIILLLPIPTVWALQMRTSAKIALTGVFCVGLLVSIIAIIRMITLAQLDFANLTATMVYASFWSTTEPILAIMSVCLPMLHPILVHFWPTRFRSSINSGPNTDSNFSNSKKSANSKHFERLHGNNPDAYPLAKMYVGNGGLQGETKATAYPPEDSGHSLNNSMDTSDRISHESTRELRRETISVLTEWEVNRSSSAPPKR